MAPKTFQGFVRVRAAMEHDDPGIRRKPRWSEKVAGKRRYAVAFEAHDPFGWPPDPFFAERLGQVALVHFRPILRERSVALRHEAVENGS